MVIVVSESFYFMIWNFRKFFRESLNRGMGVVVVGFFVIFMIKCRVRFCLLVSYTKEMLDEVGWIILFLDKFLLD